MNILQINVVSNYSSTGRTTYELSGELRKQNIKNSIAYSYGDSVSNGYRIGSLFDTKVHALLSRITGLQGYFSRKATKRLIKYIMISDFDIIHLRNLHSNFINLKVLFNYLKASNKAVVLTLHDCWFFTGKCCYYSSLKCFKWKSECYKCPAKRLWNKSWFFDFSKKMFKDKKNYFNKLEKLAVVGVSDWITNEANQSFLAEAQIVKRIYNWIDFSVFKPKDTSKVKSQYNQNNDFVILGVSSVWSSEKGLFDFVELAEKINSNMKIILIGKIPLNVELPNNIQNISETNNLETLALIYSLADVFITMSKEETFGKVSAEALATGTPVICYDTTACSELVGYNCGYVVQLGDVEEINAKVLKVYKKGKKYYSPFCIQFAKMNFQKEYLINEYIDLYEEILKI